ncbi:MAG: hypothetical protein AVDCRST_MAG49-221, partial [uncultured Thermomicrobiales bacterium]
WRTAAPPWLGVSSRGTRIWSPRPARTGPPLPRTHELLGVARGGPSARPGDRTSAGRR